MVADVYLVVDRFKIGSSLQSLKIGSSSSLGKSLAISLLPPQGGGLTVESHLTLSLVQFYHHLIALTTEAPRSLSTPFTSIASQHAFFRLSYPFSRFVFSFSTRLSDKRHL